MTHCPHCGCDLQPEKGKPRSVEQLRRFFGMLRAMYRHWPETAEFQPESEEALRKWVLIKAGHKDTTDIAVPFADDQPGLTRLVAVSVEACVRGAGGYAFIRPHPDGGLLRVFKAKSIAFDKLGQSMGAYGERVSDPQQLKPALQRALASGGCAVIHVDVDPVKHMWAPGLIHFKKMHEEPKG